MKSKMILSKNNAENFIKELKYILSDPHFNLSKDLDILLKKHDELPADPFTTYNTLIALDLDSYDVYKYLLSLDISEYLETMIDNIDGSLPPFHVFCKIIKNREVYIKIKIRDKNNLKVFCISFHFA